jgi:hypothetical protein
MRRNFADGPDELAAVHAMTPGQQVDVGEVTPPGAQCPARDSGDDLLRENHGERVAEHREFAAEQSRDLDGVRWGMDRVAHVHVDVELRPRRPQTRGHGHAYAGMYVFVPNQGGLRSRQIEGDAVIDVDACDLVDRGQHRIRIAGLALGEEVDVAGRTALAEGGEQRPAFEDVALGETAARESGEKALENVELKVFVDGPAISASALLDVEVGAAGRGRT